MPSTGTKHRGGKPPDPQAVEDRIVRRSHLSTHEFSRPFLHSMDARPRGIMAHKIGALWYVEVTIGKGFKISAHHKEYLRALHILDGKWQLRKAANERRIARLDSNWRNIMWSAVKYQGGKNVRTR